MNTTFNIYDLAKGQKMKGKREKELYKVVYEKVQRKIKCESKRNKTFCVYEIPPIIFGYPPIVDRFEVATTVSSWLRNGGFNVQVYNNHYIQVMWDHVDLYQMKEKMVKDEEERERKEKEMKEMEKEQTWKNGKTISILPYLQKKASQIQQNY